MTSIIIPAHNEEKVIERCLRPFKHSAEHDGLEVIVVCNGCTDQTANRVSKISDKITCIETDKASKANALNIGDEVAQSFPRFYIDADISVSMEAISKTEKILEDGYMAASPEVEFNIADSSWIVKAYYQVWKALPYSRAAMIGTGIYALSSEGRSRFKHFPNVISDDSYVRCLFKKSERGSVQGHYSIVNTPKSLTDLIRIKTRSRLGTYELIDRFPEIMESEQKGKDYSGAMNKLMLDARMWPKVFLYITINLFTRARAMWQKKNNVSIWERDNSSRSV